MGRGVSVALVGALAAISPIWPACARAEHAQGISDRFQVSVAGTTATLDTEASVGPAGGGAGAILVMEDLFGLPVHKNFIEIEGTWKYAGRHHIDVGYLDIGRTSQRQIETDAEFGGYTFQAGAMVEAYFDSRFLYAGYRMDVLRAEPVRISVSGGISVTRLTARLSGTGDITDQNGQSVSGTATVEGMAPLPVPMLGVQLEWAVTSRSMLRSYQRFIGYQSDDIRGTIIQSVFRYHYFVQRNLGLGVGYESLSARLPMYKTDDRTLRFSYGYTGFTFYVQGAF